MTYESHILSCLTRALNLCQLHYLRLPKEIGEDHVILMDCTVSTGAAAMMAVRVLLVGVCEMSCSL